MKKYQSVIKYSSALLLALSTVFISAEYQELQAQGDSNATIEEIAEEEVTPGEEVSVRGEIEAVEPGVSFLIQESGFLEGDEVLVINVSETLLTEEAEDLAVQVTGELGTLVLADVEQDYGLDLDPELYVDYESQPVIFASSMVASPEIEEVSENPDLYYGQEISLEGEVGEIKNEFAFMLKEDQLVGGDNLLIINATGEPIPEADNFVVITGIVRPFVTAEFERDYDLTWDLDVQQEIEAEYTEKPVLVVENIYPSAKDEGLLE
ncbi:MAG: hypothetical protein AAF298_24845 [Cyanobacteria bacterium P01_A01_bin.40]